MKDGIFLLLGSNLNDPPAQLARARQEISRYAGDIIQASSLYRTAPWGITNQPEFLNQVIALRTAPGPFQLLEILQAIEQQMGRERVIKWGARVIDIDMLFYHNEIIRSAALTLPHPAIPERRFTLAPLAEIAPSFVHPVLKEDMAAMLAACADTSLVAKVEL